MSIQIQYRLHWRIRNDFNTDFTIRLAKLLRLLRLVKIVKVLKWMMGYKKKKEAIGHEDNDDEIGMKMSVVGRTMTESITKKGE